MKSLEQAKKLILDPDSHEYIDAHDFGSSKKSEEIPLILKYQFGDQELVAFGARHTSGSPGHPMLKRIIEEFKDYVGRVPKEKRLAMVEGFHDGKPRPEETLEASAKFGEPTMVTFLAKQYEAEAISPEAPDEKVLEDLLEKGMTRENIALFHLLRPFSTLIRQKESLSQGRLALWLVRIEKYFNPGWTRKFSDEEIEELKKRSKLADHQAEEIVAEAVPKVNKVMQSVFKMDLFAPINEWNVDFIPDEETIRGSSDPSPWVKNKTILNQISRIVGDTRDYYILDKLDEVVRAGKSPFIVYGRSHIIRLKPALDYLYGN